MTLNPDLKIPAIDGEKKLYEQLDGSTLNFMISMHWFREVVDSDENKIFFKDSVEKNTPSENHIKAIISECKKRTEFYEHHEKYLLMAQGSLLK